MKITVESVSDIKRVTRYARVIVNDMQKLDVTFEDETYLIEEGDVLNAFCGQPVELTEEEELKISNMIRKADESGHKNT